MTAFLFVLAGVNGAGKSSIGGAILRRRGLSYFNPDKAALEIRRELGCTTEEANAKAWYEGKRILESAIHDRTNHAFETTLGGNTIPQLLVQAANAGFDVRVWFVGLSSPEQHIARVRARVATGGHDIPEAKIRERWIASRRNIADLMPHLRELRVFDNSEERDRTTGRIPPLELVLHWKDGSVIAPQPKAVDDTPEWAKPIVARALQLQRGA